MVVCLNPGEECVSETLNSLNFAARVRSGISFLRYSCSYTSSIADTLDPNVCVRSSVREFSPAQEAAREHKVIQQARASRNAGVDVKQTAMVYGDGRELPWFQCCNIHGD